ncbi:hypothetical protein Misp02_66620 [Microtetraspora sp. NBRC 16547]|nr:DUF2079 domain-containing protein [Microtetraspora sp. NBRC 16547]GLX02576.1 hypothetical protein Misp02_66620 [Microtetraspora sp. NBRC 16547]
MAGFGLALLFYREWRRMGSLLAVLGALYTAVATQVVIPAAGGSSHRYWAYSKIGANVPDALQHMLLHPLETAGVFVSPVAKVGTLLWLAVLPLLTAFASPFALTFLPMLAMRMLATDLPNWWSTGFHYNSAVVMAIFAAGVDGARRIAESEAVTRRLRAKNLDFPRVWSWGTLAVGLVSIPFFALAQLFTPAFYSPSPRQEAAEAALARVPDGALVEVANALGPNITGRAGVVIWRDMPRRAPWVIADVVNPQPIFASLQEQAADVEALRRCGYMTVFARDGYVVMRAASPDGEQVLTTPQDCSK